MPRDDAPKGRVADALEKLLGTLDLDELGDTRAALARSLALKVDQVLYHDSPEAAKAMAGISKELREVLEAIQEASDDSADYVDGLFAPVGNSAKS